MTQRKGLQPWSLLCTIALRGFSFHREAPGGQPSSLSKLSHGICLLSPFASIPATSQCWRGSVPDQNCCRDHDNQQLLACHQHQHAKQNQSQGRPHRFFCIRAHVTTLKIRIEIAHPYIFSWSRWNPIRATPRQIMVKAASTSQCRIAGSCVHDPTTPSARCDRK